MFDESSLDGCFVFLQIIAAMGSKELRHQGDGRDEEERVAEYFLSLAKRNKSTEMILLLLNNIALRTTRSCMDGVCANCCYQSLKYSRSGC